MKSIQQTFSVPFQYQVLFTEKLFHTNNTLLAELVRSQQKPKVYYVVDSGVAEVHPTLLRQINKHAQHYAKDFTLCAQPLIVPGGEQAKNDTKLLQQIVEATHTYSIDRHSYIIAIGGGAVLDLVGFASAVSHRGIRHIRIPTTVLSQNDSGVGVKNGINYFGKKNYLGSFAPPFAVINDFDFLSTLNDRDWRAGISEAIKVALIKDEAFFKQLEKDAEALASREAKPMQELIYRCAELHLEHISGGDPFEMGSSRPLDFGHWAAHKLEQLTNYEVRHGEAVAIGIALDVTYSQLKGMISEEDLHRVIYLLKVLGFTLYVPQMEQEEIVQGLQEFREHLGGELTIMLLEAIGRGVEVHQMDVVLIREAISKLEVFEESDLIV
ncbi:3-dehydroquinate synthase [Catalinimonas alkaloidigena]|uniref:3-dehydroquinate synthase n=1 Tax=Catalinimonas alkaloidigena TaxID=1075417 RepID=UPI0024066D61|nr:3-dehydroquinate synthase [Catalinimonas alkaloidigena]MDF9800679.1 3-dehydroquinate synthase [Catalinimonas alkaloidigena]